MVRAVVVGGSFAPTTGASTDRPELPGGLTPNPSKDRGSYHVTKTLIEINIKIICSGTSRQKIRRTPPTMTAHTMLQKPS